MGKRLNALICGKFGKRAAYIIRVSAQTVRKERRVLNIIKQNIYNANIFDIYKFRKISMRACGISLSVLSVLSALSAPFYAFLRLSMPFCAFCAFLCLLCPSVLSVPFCQSAFVSAPLPSRRVTVMLGTNIGCNKSNMSSHILFRLSV